MTERTAKEQALDHHERQMRYHEDRAIELRVEVYRARNADATGTMLRELAAYETVLRTYALGSTNETAAWRALLEARGLMVARAIWTAIRG